MSLTCLEAMVHRLVTELSPSQIARTMVYNGARPVESNHQEAETIGSSDEASRSAFNVSGGHGTCTCISTFVEMNVGSLVCLIKGL